MTDESPLVYISCAAEDRPAGEMIRAAIVRHGLRCEMTPPLQADATGLAAAETAIGLCRVLVVIVSRHANGCTEVLREIDYAGNREMWILPVRADDAKLSPELEFYLSTRHWMDAVGKTSQAVLDELIPRIENLAVTKPGSLAGERFKASRHRPGRVWTARHVRALSLAAFGSLVVGFAWLGWNGGPEEAKALEEPTWVAEGGKGVLRLSSDVTVRFRWCPSGTFTPRKLFGSTASAGAVTLPNGFWLGEFEITQAQWQTVMGDNPSVTRGPRHPVESISWNDIQAFLDKLNGLGVGQFRLPTRIEWEYACRAGRSGDPTDDDVAAQAWTTRRHHPVGEKAPNDWGLFDMFGNVNEWCSDSLAAYPGWRTYGDSSWKTLGFSVAPSAEKPSNLGFRLCRDADVAEIPAGDTDMLREYIRYQEEEERRQNQLFLQR